MKELRKLGRSFSYAAKGIGWAVRTQRNMRIHLTALVLVVVFGFVEGLRPTHWCLELLCCMAVISLELMNSALESACDAITREKNPQIGRAKDAAAGAVLVAAFGSVVVALVILLGSGYWGNSKGTCQGALVAAAGAGFDCRIGGSICLSAL